MNAAANVAVQFDDSDQQRSASLLGMWVFLATEVLFFGGMVVAYVVYRHEYGEAFGQASNLLNVWLGGAMTAALLLGSLLVALTEHATEIEDDPRRIRQFVFHRLVGTAILGIIFLSCECYEYSQLLRENLIPGSNFDSAQFSNLPFAGAAAQIYFVLFFCMTGLHAFHMMLGVALVTWAAIAARWLGRMEDWANMLAVIGLYWHFVDIVWIFLYPMFYLVA